MVTFQVLYYVTTPDHTATGARSGAVVGRFGPCARVTGTRMLAHLNHCLVRQRSVPYTWGTCAEGLPE